MFWPIFSLAETDISGIINNPDKIELKQKEAKKILNSLIQKIVDEKIYTTTSSNFSLEKQVVLVIVEDVISRDLLNYLMIDVPIETGKNLAKFTVKAVSLILSENMSGILDQIESVTVNKAKEYAMEWLLQKEIRAASGNLETSYKGYSGNQENIVLPCIIVYKSLDYNRAEIGIEIYSSTNIKTPLPTRNHQWEGGIEELKPFILRINGEVERQNDGVYVWTKNPEFKLVFDEPVPVFDFKKPGFFDSIKNRLNEVRIAIDRGVKTIGDLITGAAQDVKENSGGALDKMRSLFSNLNIFKAFVGSELSFPQDDSGVDFSKINIENLNSEEQINKITEQLTSEKGQLEGAIKESQSGEESDFSLEKAQEALDDISEKIDLLAQEIDELVAASNKNSDEFAYENNGEEAAGEEADLVLPEPVDDEGKQGINKITSVSTASSHGGGGGSSPVYSKILISEVQISGLIDEKEEFVELYNPNNEEISLTGWYLHRKTETGSSYSTFASSNLFSGKEISAKGYFLIARQGSAFASSADIVTESSLGNNGSSSTLVIKNPNGEISDKLGFGVPQEYKTSPAQSPEKGKSLGRKWNNDTEQDTDNNLADFEIQNPSPKSKNISPAAVPPTESPPSEPESTTDNVAPSTVFNLNSGQTSLNFVVDFEITDLSTENVSPSGLAVFQFCWKEDGGEWQEDAVKNITDAPATYNGSRDFTGQDETIYYFQIKAKDVNNNESVWLSEIPIFTKISLPKTILINEIQVNENEFVELYNYGEYDLNLTNLYFSYFPATLDTEGNPKYNWNDPYHNKSFSEALITIIPAKGYYLIGLKGYPIIDGNLNADWQPYTSDQLSNSKGGVVIFPWDPKTKTIEEAEQGRIDAVGWGNAIIKEGSAAPAPPEEKSIGRKELGLDTDDNGQDFIVNEIISPTNSKNQTLQPAVEALAIWPVFQHDAQHTGRSNFAGPTAVNDITAYDLGLEGPSFTAVLQPVIGSDKTIYFGVDEPEAKLYAINPDGTKKWEAVLDSWAIAIALGPDNVIYASIRDKGIVAFDSEGAEKWRFYPDGASEVSAAAINEDGIIYFTDYSNLYCINPDGSQNWLTGNAPRGGGAFGGPVIGPDNTIYVVWPGFQNYMDLDRGQLFAYNPDATVKWRSPLEFGAGAPIIDSTNSIIYVTTGNSGPLGTTRMVLAFGFDGVEKWRSEREDGSFLSALSADNFLIQADNWSTIVGYPWGSAVEQPMSQIKAFDSDGNVVWTIGPEPSSNIITQPISDKNGNIYFGETIYEESNTGAGWWFPVSGYKLYSVDRNGAINWSYGVSGEFLSSLAIGDSNNILVPVSEGSEDMKEAIIYSLGE